MASAPAKEKARKGAAKKTANRRAPVPRTKKKATAKKAAKRKRAKRVPGGKAPGNQVNALAVLKQAHPGITAEQVAVLYNMPPEEVLKRRAFVHEYLKDFSEERAALRMGYPPETARSTGSILLYHAFTQLRITEILESLSVESVVSGTQVVAALWREANAPDIPFSSNASTRIAALKELAKITKLVGPGAGGIVPPPNSGGGVMIIPFTADPETWEKVAQDSQKRLKASVAIDAEEIPLPE